MTRIDNAKLVAESRRLMKRYGVPASTAGRMAARKLQGREMFEICEKCGKKFPPTRATAGDKARRFCTRSCQLAAHNERRRADPVPRSCGWCETKFTTSDPRQCYCSARCRQNATNARRAAQGAVL